MPSGADFELDAVLKPLATIVRPSSSWTNEEVDAGPGVRNAAAAPPTSTSAPRAIASVARGPSMGDRPLRRGRRGPPGVWTHAHRRLSSTGADEDTSRSRTLRHHDARHAARSGRTGRDLAA